MSAFFDTLFCEIMLQTHTQTHHTHTHTHTHIHTPHVRSRIVPSSRVGVRSNDDASDDDNDNDESVSHVMKCSTHTYEHTLVDTLEIHQTLLDVRVTT